MRNFKIILIGLAFSLGCGKGGLDGKLDEFSKIKDEMCACKDKACSDAVQDKYKAWNKGNSKEDKPSDDQMKRYETLRKDMRECRHKAEGIDVPAAPAAAPPAAPAEGSAAPAPATP